MQKRNLLIALVIFLSLAGLLLIAWLLSVKEEPSYTNQKLPPTITNGTKPPIKDIPNDDKDPINEETDKDEDTFVMTDNKSEFQERITESPKVVQQVIVKRYIIRKRFYINQSSNASASASASSSTPEETASASASANSGSTN